MLTDPHWSTFESARPRKPGSTHHRPSPSIQPPAAVGKHEQNRP